MQLRTHPLMSYRGRSVRQAVHIVSMILVCSYIFFDVLDLDGSDFPRLLHPVQKTLIVALVPSEAELFNSPKPPVPQDSTLTPIIDQAGKYSSPLQARLLILSSLHSARAHGYRVSLARNSLSDSSFSH
jgi:hypothetical protein